MNFLTLPVVAQARHGKDTVATMLLDHDEKSYCRVALADELKIECAEYWGKKFPFFNVEFDEKGRISYPDDTDDPEQIAFRRRTWQVWGTEGRRALFPDIWFWRWACRAWKFMSTGNFVGVVVPDVRFFNEAEFFKNLGATIIGAQRFDENGDLYRGEGIDYEHGSEREIPEIIEKLADVKIRNDSTLEVFMLRLVEEFYRKGFM